MSLNRSSAPTQRLAFLTAEQDPGAARHSDGQPQTWPTPPTAGPGRLLELGRQHLPVVLALLLGVVLIAVYALGNTSTTETPAQPVAAPSVPATSGPAPSASSGPPRQLRIHVLGAVASPGVVRVPEGSIVEDALQAAGGLLPEAAPGELNLAATVADGQQVIIGTHDEPRSEVVTPTAAVSATGLLDLNTATDQQLQDLPGVGPVLAADIIAWRTEHGPFTEVSQLQEVSGVGPKTYERLAALVTV
ncbi:MAG: ComEA family DNA-binding protein [Propionibacteriaceae bacterium]|nr:ComEA family DNA-binding protein [Propionibacteriaceae bacterium]